MLERLVEISLFTERQDLDAGFSGYWAEPEWGSRLVQLKRSKLTGQSLEDHERFAAESLAWLKEEGLVREIEVAAAQSSNGKVELSIRLDQGRVQVEL